ncbi:MAG: hypothetical protein ACRCZY_10695 [Phocaeicola sp.]
MKPDIVSQISELHHSLKEKEVATLITSCTICQAKEHILARWKSCKWMNGFTESAGRTLNYAKRCQLVKQLALHPSKGKASVILRDYPTPY